MLRKSTLFFLSIVFTMLATACNSMAPENKPAIEASGIIEAADILIAPQTGGVVAEIFVDEGDQVQAGDKLFRIENDLLDAQIRQAQAAVDAARASLDGVKTGEKLAEATLDAAQAGVQAAQAQYTLTLGIAREAEQPSRLAMWQTNPPNDFSLPLWYFTKDERITAAEDTVGIAAKALQEKKNAYQNILSRIDNEEIRKAEKRLLDARADFAVASMLYQRKAASANGGSELNKSSQNLYDTAKSRLDAAQRAYDHLLTTQDAQSLMKARADLATAEERYQTALDNLNQLQTGIHSPAVKSANAALAQAKAIVRQAEVGVEQAQKAIVQAEKGLAQAQSALNTLQVQEQKLTVYAPVSGVIATRSIETGELVQPGMSTLTIARLNSLYVTVYIPENRFGEIMLGEKAVLKTDSFPEKTFPAVVSYISNHAEYTPRNVQTKEERQNTVYAVKLRITNPDGNLKPGMPADVTFTP